MMCLVSIFVCVWVSAVRCEYLQYICQGKDSGGTACTILRCCYDKFPKLPPHDQGCRITHFTKSDLVSLLQFLQDSCTTVCVFQKQFGTKCTFIFPIGANVFNLFDSHWNLVADTYQTAKAGHLIRSRAIVPFCYVSARNCSHPYVNMVMLCHIWLFKLKLRLHPVV